MRGGVNIHVVDSDPSAAEMVRNRLRSLDELTVTRFESVDGLVKALPTVVSDVVLIRVEAAAVAAALAAIRLVNSDVPIIVSGKGFSEEEALSFLGAGATDVVDEQCQRSLAIAVAAVLHRKTAAGKVGQLSAGKGEGALCSEGALHSILNALPVGVHVMDSEGKVSALNSAARAICACAGMAESGQPHDLKAWWHDTGKRIRGEEWSGFRALREGTATIGDVIDIECADGTRKTIVNSSIPLRDAEGKVTSAVLVHEDITEMKRLEEQVMQAHKMDSVGLLAGGVAHDFNNLLTAINGYSQIIQENIPVGDELLSSSIEQVLAAGRRASDLTHKLLAFSRRQPLTLATLKIDDVIANAATVLSRLVGTNVSLTTSLGSMGVRVMADGAQLDQVLLNLVMNACDAMAAGAGTIRLSTHEEILSDADARTLCLEKGGPYAVVSVTDNGKGIDEKMRKRIFEPFFTTKEKARGSGLGLSIIYGIIRQHNGAITVNSAPCKGSTFTVYLPVAKSKGRKLAIPQQVIPFGGAEKILLAEDDQIVREYLSTILAQSGYSVVTASDGAEAETRFRENVDNISLVITDVVMPEKNGREIHEEIKKLRPETKIIYISGYTADIINRKGIVDRNIDFLMKPVSRGDFLQKVREVLDRP